jgi:hypothetical protein
VLCADEARKAIGRSRRPTRPPATEPAGPRPDPLTPVDAT